MSIVSVHGPQTFGSKSIVQNGPLVARMDPTNGLKWTLSLAVPSRRSDQDFSWAFPPNGTPTPQTVEAPTVVTYATAGNKTVTLTVTNTAKATVNNKALTNNVATLGFSAAHGFVKDQVVVVSGVDATFNGTYIITAVGDSTHISYACVAANVTSGAATGTVTSASTQIPAAGSYQIVVPATDTSGGVGPMLLINEGEGDVVVTATEPDPVPDSSWTKADITAWLTDHGVSDISASLTKAELLDLVQSVTV